MVVHYVRIYCEDPNNTNLDTIRTEVQNWVSNHTEWTNDREPHTVNRVDQPFHSVVFLTGTFRFTTDSDRLPLLDEAENTLQQNVGWYRICYHQCDHDEASHTGCSNDPNNTREYGTIPTDIPTC